MKKINYILISLLVLMSFSCKKFLEEKPTGFISPDANLTSKKVAQAYTVGCYKYLQGFLAGQPSSYGGNVYNVMEFLTGKSNSDLGQTGFSTFSSLSYIPSSFYFDTWWQQLYLGVGACNLAIEKLPTFTVLTDVEKTNMLAEAKALRALYYFYLVRMYGAVPKVTQMAQDLNIYFPRTPAKQIYDEIIIPDLVAAANSTLPWRATTVSLGFIHSLTADVYLTYAGAAINGGADYYAKSAAESKMVIEQSGNTLFKEYTDMINPANKGIGEFIFQVQYSAAVPSTNPLTALLIPNYSGISKYSDEYGSVYPTSQFLATYLPGDKRRAEKQFFYSSYKSIKDNSIVTFRQPYIYKFFDSLAVTSTAKSDLNFTIYRLADVELMYAEASNRATGTQDALATQSVNDIRGRAQLTPIGKMSMTDFEHEVWIQRYWELCYENKMWFDMLRTRKVHNDVTGNWDDFIGHTTVFGATFAEKNLLFPVPQQEIDANQNLLPNNPGFK
ncbi:RagB/SusD family nutrient uptake outer membrane protein [Chitinophaga silvatica]|uniref:RagB/SusD family nutrient uptake outer membrane protein n=1 Tax=Chitinophaga silvatica TaxID=2282649 RepID=A0A3E1Y6D6_9BACT|nr:RagB/SusD family nutrient uptake outer membrane protein [Chitinophaga silvatica]RFS20495.1 RagB/SusD family nutrient uptake outer membrane protein [Chitinophaga silvatica]